MRKKVWAVVIAAGLLGACGQVTSEDIRSAARQNADDEAASALSLPIGNYWVSREASKTTREFGTVRTTGEFDGIAANNRVNEAVDTKIDKSMQKTYIEAVDKNGFVIERVSRRTSAKSSVGSTTTEGNLSNLDTRSGYVYYELDRWARMIPEGFGDNDQNPGFAVNPIAPVMGAVYTDDRGNVWKAVGADTVAGFKTVKLTRVFAAQRHDITKFYEACVVRSAGTGATSNYDIKASCQGVGNWIDNGGNAEFTLEQTEDIWVGRQVVLKHASKTVKITLDSIVCQGTVPVAGSLNPGNQLTDCAGNVVFENGGGGTDEKRTDESTSEVTKFASSADKTALPNIDTDAQ